MPLAMSLPVKCDNYSMTNEANSHDRMRAILVIVATIATIAFNGLAAAGYVNGVTPAVILDKYPTVLTPAGYAFTIWSVIYMGLAAFSIYQLLPRNLARYRSIRPLYVFSCVLNCTWIYFWHSDQIAVCFAIILVLLAVLLLIQIRLNGCGSFAEIWLQQAPFGLYFGWVTAVSIVNFMVLLDSLGLNMPVSSGNILGAALIAAATAGAVVARIKLRNFFYPLAIAWALTAIAIKQGGHTAIVVTAAFGVVICFVTTGSFVVNLRDSTSE
jgi:hypothetical protein